MDGGLVAALTLYAAGLLALGLRPAGSLAGLDAFFLAGRRLGAWRVAFSLTASWAGAASLLVSTDEAYRGGLSAVWLVGVPAVATLLVFLPLSGRIRAQAGRTLGEMVGDAYGRPARAATSFLIVWYMAVLAASQMVALGAFLKAFLGVNRMVGVSLAAALVFLYSGAGGLVAVARTHVLQFFLLLAGVAALLASLLGRVQAGAVGRAAAAAGKDDYFYIFDGFSSKWLIALSFVLAWTVSPIAWQRMQAARSGRAARTGLAGAALCLGLFYAGVTAAGMLMLPALEGASVEGPVISAYVTSFGGPFLLYAVFLSVTAAIMSTLDAAVNAGAFSLAADALRLGLFREGRPARAALGPLTTLVVVACASAVAMRFEGILQTLGLAAKVMAEGLFIPGMAALFLKRRSPLAGTLSLFAGGGFALCGFLQEAGLVSAGLPVWPYSLLPGVGLSAAAFLCGFLIKKGTGTLLKF
jgi:SSS family solute:Na+ symporter